MAVSAKKRITPDEDLDRLAERVWRRGRGKIRNKADFIAVYEGYMGGSNVRGRDDVREGTFEKLAKKHPKVKREVFTKRERVEAFVSAGRKPAPSEFDFPGVIKGRRVFARRTKFKKPGGGEQTVFRDKKGRFVSVKRR